MSPYKTTTQPSLCKEGRILSNPLWYGQAVRSEMSSSQQSVRTEMPAAQVARHPGELWKTVGDLGIFARGPHVKGVPLQSATVSCSVLQNIPWHCRVEPCVSKPMREHVCVKVCQRKKHQERTSAIQLCERNWASVLIIAMSAAVDRSSSLFGYLHIV